MHILEMKWHVYKMQLIWAKANNTSVAKIEIVQKKFWSKKLGKVSLYRPSNKKLDFEIPFHYLMLLLCSYQKKFGRRSMGHNMEWQYDGKSYLTKETIY
jgi:hypothetical protein